MRKAGDFCFDWLTDFILHACLSFADFFSKSIVSKNYFRNTMRVSKTVWIQIRTDVLSGLVSVQTVCKGYQQMILGGKVKS